MSILSLIIPVYNTERYLERCLDSILKQSYAQIEVIVVDDCSPGNTDEIIEKYIKRIEGLSDWLGIDTNADYAKKSIEITIL